MVSKPEKKPEKNTTPANASSSAAYAQAGVDITKGYEAVRLMKEHVARTLPQGMTGAIGGFGGAFPLADALAGMQNPQLVSGTDGVGTKIRIAQLLDKHTTIGIDCVAMCANDIVCCGARPLFFLDYIACGALDPQRVASIVEGVAEGCVQGGAALIGGETAEHPGLMDPEDYDLAGFCVGVVDTDAMLGPGRVEEGDVLLALPSSGVHSNGFSLVRRVCDVEHADLSAPVEELGGTSLGSVLLEPTVMYVKPVLALLADPNVCVHSVAHITGGGFYENIPRALPSQFVARIDVASLRTPAIFDYLAQRGNISEHDMFNTFNMGVGMCVVVDYASVDAALACLGAQGVDAYVMGRVVPASSQTDARVELV